MNTTNAKAASLTAEKIAWAMQDANGSIYEAADALGVPLTPFRVRYRSLRAEVDAILMAAPCPGCGKVHRAPYWPPFCHVAEVKRRNDPVACVVTRSASYPYECGAKDMWPGDEVWRCESHGCWWHDVPAT